MCCNIPKVMCYSNYQVYDLLPLDLNKSLVWCYHWVAGPLALKQRTTHMHAHTVMQAPTPHQKAQWKTMIESGTIAIQETYMYKHKSPIHSVVLFPLPPTTPVVVSHNTTSKFSQKATSTMYTCVDSREIISPPKLYYTTLLHVCTCSWILGAIQGLPVQPADCAELKAEVEGETELA